MASVGVKGMKLTLKVKQRKAGAPPPPKFLGHGSCHNLSHSRDLSNSTATREWKDLFAVAMKILAELNVPVGEIRGIGIVMSKLVCDDTNIDDQVAPKQGIAKWLMGPDSKSDWKSDTSGNKDLSSRVRFSETSAHSDSNQKDECASELTILKGIHDNLAGSEKANIFCDNPAHIARATSEEDELDVAIPSLSQIHMSQVAELPSPFRNHIRSKIEQEKAKKKVADCTHMSLEQKSSRFFQTDVQRMFRLVAVKSGERPLENEPGLAVSLTQLECLPFEVQLQLANNDKRRIGFLSPGKKKSARSGATVGKSESHSCKKHDEMTKPINESINASESSVDEITDPRAFYSENVLPLRVFMDENPVCAEATTLVTSFLSICVTEGRVPDAIVLLRSIKNRNDAWGNFAFESIWLSVKSEIETYCGSQLDIEWALQTT
jgi:DNA repair protein REV1